MKHAPVLTMLMLAVLLALPGRAEDLPFYAPEDSWDEADVLPWDTEEEDFFSSLVGESAEEDRVYEDSIQEESPSGESPSAEGEKIPPLDTAALYDLLDQAAQEADARGYAGEWFSSGEEGVDPGAGKGHVSDPTPTPVFTPTSFPEPTVVPDPTRTPTPAATVPLTPTASPTVTPHPDFTVEKEALSRNARPGDTVLYTIRITNTGNVPLHSVVSTEKFATAGIKAYFEAQEGVLLNDAHTQARIEEIAPGQEAVLHAYVIVPTRVSAGELLNQVEVTTEETGPHTTVAEDTIPLMNEEPARENQIPQGTTYVYQPTGGTETVIREAITQTAPVYGETPRVIPQTGDETPLLPTLLALLFSEGAILKILREKGHRKD